MEGSDKMRCFGGEKYDDTAAGSSQKNILTKQTDRALYQELTAWFRLSNYLATVWQLRWGEERKTGWEISAEGKKWSGNQIILTRRRGQFKPRDTSQCTKQSSTPIVWSSWLCGMVTSGGKGNDDMRRFLREDATTMTQYILTTDYHPPTAITMIKRCRHHQLPTLSGEVSETGFNYSRGVKVWDISGRTLNNTAIESSPENTNKKCHPCAGRTPSNPHHRGSPLMW